MVESKTATLDQKLSALSAAADFEIQILNGQPSRGHALRSPRLRKRHSERLPRLKARPPSPCERHPARAWARAWGWARVGVRGGAEEELVLSSPALGGGRGQRLRYGGRGGWKPMWREDRCRAELLGSKVLNSAALFVCLIGSYLFALPCLFRIY